jgi:magnesium transporter
VCSPSKRLSGGLPLADLLRADPELRLGEVVRRVQRARVDAELEEIARLMADYDLTVVPVVDEEERQRVNAPLPVHRTLRWTVA